MKPLRLGTRMEALATLPGEVSHLTPAPVAQEVLVAWCGRRTSAQCGATLLHACFQCAWAAMDVVAAA